MADLLSQLVQALRNGGLSKPAASSAAPAAGSMPGSVAQNPAATGTGSLPPLSNPQLLAVMAVARDQLLMTIGRQQVTITPQQLPAAPQPIQLGQQVLVQQTANQLHTMLWQQVTSQLQQLQQGSRALPSLQQPVQLQPPPGNPAQLIMSGPASGKPLWQVNLSQLAPNLTRQLLASASPAAPAPTQAPAQLTLRLLPATSSAPAPQVQLQLARPGQTSVQADIPLAKLPPALIEKLIGTPARTTPLTSLNQPVTASQPAATAAAPLLTPATQNPTRALLPLQGNQLAPTELRQLIQQLASQLATAATQPATNTTAAQPAAAAATPAATLQNLLQAVATQLPQGADFTRSEALQQWVSQWFAARPVSLNPQQSLGGIGQLLLLTLAARLGQTTGQPAATTTATNNFSQNLAQWLQGQPPGPATANAAAPAANPAAANALSFANLPANTLQQLLQVLSGGLNSARFSQAILTESSRVGAPDYHILLPMGTGPQQKDAEVLIQRRLHEKKRKAEAAEDQWLFKLKMELSQYGPVLVKGKYQQSGTSIVFITENIGARVHIQERLKFLQARLDQLQVPKVELSAIRGKVPDTLREPGENSIHIQV